MIFVFHKIMSLEIVDNSDWIVKVFLLLMGQTTLNLTTECFKLLYTILIILSFSSWILLLVTTNLIGESIFLLNVDLTIIWIVSMCIWDMFSWWLNFILLIFSFMASDKITGNVNSPQVDSIGKGNSRMNFLMYNIFFLINIFDNLFLCTPWSFLM